MACRWGSRVTAPGALPTQQQVVMRLSELSRFLDAKTAEIATLDEAEQRAKAAHKVAFARSFLETSGSVDFRKQTAVLATADLELAFDLAAVQTRAAREAIRTLRDQLDVGRSLNAAARVNAQADGSITSGTA